MGAQQLDAASRREELTWIDDVPDPVQHNLKGGRTYYVVENTFDAALIQTIFRGRANDLYVEVIPPPAGRKCGAWYATYRVP
jgi:hypothetical protein